MTMSATRPKAPYAPVQNVVEFIHKVRDRELAQPVTLATLEAIGIPEGNRPRTLQALKFLRVLQEDGYYDEAAEQLKLAGTDEYPEVLAGLLRSAYALVFKMVDPATDPEYRIADAFRQYQPDGQRSRMVTLFLGLCAEAGIVSRAKRALTHDTKRAGRNDRRVRSAARESLGSPIAPLSGPRPPTQQADGPIVLPVTEADVAAWNDQEFTAAWAAIGTVVRLTAQKRQAARKQTTVDPFLGLFAAQAGITTPEDSEAEK